jgi:hypothetical protein
MTVSIVQRLRETAVTLPADGVSMLAWHWEVNGSWAGF